jgi:hypothetical protein
VLQAFVRSECSELLRTANDTHQISLQLTLAKLRHSWRSAALQALVLTCYVLHWLGLVAVILTAQVRGRKRSTTNVLCPVSLCNVVQMQQQQKEPLLNQQAALAAKESTAETESRLRRRQRYNRRRKPPPPKTTLAAVLMTTGGIAMSVAGVTLWFTDPDEKERAYALLVIGGIREFCAMGIHFPMRTIQQFELE